MFRKLPVAILRSQSPPPSPPYFPNSFLLSLPLPSPLPWPLRSVKVVLQVLDDRCHFLVLFPFYSRPVLFISTVLFWFVLRFVFIEEVEFNSQVYNRIHFAEHCLWGSISHSFTSDLAIGYHLQLMEPSLHFVKLLVRTSFQPSITACNVC